MYNVKCTYVPPLYQNSLEMITNVLNTDPILSVPNATGVPIVKTVPKVPKMTNNDPSVPINTDVVPNVPKITMNDLSVPKAT